MDVFAVVGGKQYAAMRDGYRAMSEMYGAFWEGATKQKSLGKIVGIGLTRASITYVQYNTKGLPHDVACVFGEMSRDMANALFDGKSAKEAARAGVNGAWRGIENAIVDRFTLGLGKKGEQIIPGLDNIGTKIKNFEIAGKINECLVTITDDVSKVWCDEVLNGQ